MFPGPLHGILARSIGRQCRLLYITRFMDYPATRPTKTAPWPKPSKNQYVHGLLQALPNRGSLIHPYGRWSYGPMCLLAGKSPNVHGTRPASRSPASDPCPSRPQRWCGRSLWTCPQSFERCGCHEVDSYAIATVSAISKNWRSLLWASCNKSPTTWGLNPHTYTQCG